MAASRGRLRNRCCFFLGGGCLVLQHLATPGGGLSTNLMLLLWYEGQIKKTSTISEETQ